MRRKRMEKRKLGCSGCPICGTGHCREDGLPEDCTNHVRKRVEDQFPGLALERIQLSYLQHRNMDEGF